MKDAVTKLLKVKSLVTLAMTAALVILLFSKVEPPKELISLFSTTYGAVITYFFTRKDDENSK